MTDPRWSDSRPFQPTITPDHRPTPLTYAQLNQVADTQRLIPSQVLHIHGSPWHVVLAQQHPNHSGGVLFHQPDTQQLVLVFQSMTSLRVIWETLQTALRQHTVSQRWVTATSLITQAMTLAQNSQATLSFTGHALGGFFASLSVWHCWHQGLSAVSAVTFDTPGAQPVLAQLQSMLPNAVPAELDALDLTHYLTAPNRVNTYAPKVGTCYQLNATEAVDTEWTPWTYARPCDPLSHIVTALTPWPNSRYQGGEPARVYAWPLGSQRQAFFKQAEFTATGYRLTVDLDSELDQNPGHLVYQGSQAWLAAHQAKSDDHRARELGLGHFQPAL